MSDEFCFSNEPLFSHPTSDVVDPSFLTGFWWALVLHAMHSDWRIFLTGCHATLICQSFFSTANRASMSAHRWTFSEVDRGRWSFWSMIIVLSKEYMCSKDNFMTRRGGAMCPWFSFLVVQLQSIDSSDANRFADERPLDWTKLATSDAALIDQIFWWKAYRLNKVSFIWCSFIRLIHPMPVDLLMKGLSIEWS